MYIIQYFNTLLIYIYADTLTVTWGALIERLPTDGEEGRREGKFFPQVFSVMVKARESEHGNARSFTRKLPHGDKNDWLLKERVG